VMSGNANSADLSIILGSPASGNDPCAATLFSDSPASYDELLQRLKSWRL
jgi:hypothetical protein